MNGGSWKKVGRKSSAEYGDDYGQTYKVEVRSVNSEGQHSGIAAKTVSTDDPPTPKIVAGKGEPQSVDGCENSKNCFAITGDFTDFAANESLSCDIWGDNGAERPIRQKSVTMNGDGATHADNLGVWGQQNRDFWIRCTGDKSGTVNSNKLRWWR